MFLLLAHRAELEVRRDDDKWYSLRSTKNRYGLLCHPLLRLLCETRPILLDDHVFLLLVRVDPGLRWIFGKPGLLQTM